MAEFNIRNFFSNKNKQEIESNLQKTTEMNILLKNIKINCKEIFQDDYSYVITIKEDDLKALNIENINNLFNTIKINKESSNEFKINSHLTVINTINNNELNESYYKIQTSQNNDIVYFITSEKIVIIAKGKRLDQEHLFFTEEEMIKYSMKPSVNELDKILSVYGKDLNNDKSKIKSFFIDDVTIQRNQFSKNTLKREHLDLMLISLSKFLSVTMKEDFICGKFFGRDNIIYTEDNEGKIVCIEINCFGEYLNLDGITTTKDSNDSMIKSLNEHISSIKSFIIETISELKKTVDLFKLVIFDASENFVELRVEEHFKKINNTNFSVYSSIKLNNE